LLRQRFARTIPDVASQVVFLPRLTHDDFLSLNAACDVLLDPIHFGGGNTAYEALALGVPIVTWPSPFLRGRITLALYKKIGVLDCVVNSADEYVERAVRLGTEPDYRAEVQAKILTACGALYEEIEAVRELEQFFKDAVARAHA
jgi:predicted O-linked N-acetylglucosamine transferase (SPINDLY family)